MNTAAARIASQTASGIFPPSAANLSAASPTRTISHSAGCHRARNTSASNGSIGAVAPARLHDEHRFPRHHCHSAAHDTIPPARILTWQPQQRSISCCADSRRRHGIIGSYDRNVFAPRRQTAVPPASPIPRPKMSFAPCRRKGISTVDLPAAQSSSVAANRSTSRRRSP